MKYLLLDKDLYGCIIKGIFSEKSLAEKARDVIIEAEPDRIKFAKHRKDDGDEWQKNHNRIWPPGDPRHNDHPFLNMELIDIAKFYIEIIEIEEDQIVNIEGYIE